jgi:hypothetical protein
MLIIWGNKQEIYFHDIESGRVYSVEDNREGEERDEDDKIY